MKEMTNVDFDKLHIEFDQLIVYGDPVEVYTAGSRERGRPHMIGQLTLAPAGHYIFTVMRFGNPTLTGEQMEEIAELISTINETFRKIIGYNFS